MRKKLLVIHGPNINLTGLRETGIYGKESIEDINNEILSYAAATGFECEIFQSNHEGGIIDKLHEARAGCDGVVLNAGAFTHYSYAIRDAISTIMIPVIEVHFSNIHAREEFRRVSVLAPVCAGQVCGFGKYSYMLAIDGMKNLL